MVELVNVLEMIFSRGLCDKLVSGSPFDREGLKYRKSKRPKELNSNNKKTDLTIT